LTYLFPNFFTLLFSRDAEEKKEEKKKRKKRKTSQTTPGPDPASTTTLAMLPHATGEEEAVHPQTRSPLREPQ
jgi:hypothetical protein